jgi:phage FluMu protein gp41
MAEIKVPLPAGSMYGERTATVAYLRELGTADIIGAGEESEKCVLGPDREYHLVMSPTLSGLHLLRRQIARLEDGAGTVIDGPLDVALFLKLEPLDFLEIQRKAEEMDKSGQQALERMTERGRDRPAS